MPAPVNGKYNVDSSYGGPEYETLAALGSDCGIDNLEAIAKGNELCNAYGLDTISTGGTIAFAMECFENGILSEKQTDGIKLNFGNADAMVKLVEMIARKEGIGKLLAEGTVKAAEEIGNGAIKYAMHVKGQELPMHEPRLKMGLGVGYTISPTGADHCHNMHDTGYEVKIGGDLKELGIIDPMPAQQLGAAKVRMLVYRSLWIHTLNCLGFCTGWEANVWQLMKVGERCIAMERIFNMREGKSKADDYLPERFLTPFEAGPLKGVAIKANELTDAVDSYYGMVGWDKDGSPTTAKLQELGIEWVDELR